jgi:hypothetical protein
MEALQKTEPIVYTEVGIAQLLYHDYNMFQASWVLASEFSIKKSYIKILKTQKCISISTLTKGKIMELQFQQTLKPITMLGSYT